jgi:hypothetical protein
MKNLRCLPTLAGRNQCLHLRAVPRTSAHTLAQPPRAPRGAAALACPAPLNFRDRPAPPPTGPPSLAFPRCAGSRTRGATRPGTRRRPAPAECTTRCGRSGRWASARTPRRPRPSPPRCPPLTLPRPLPRPRTQPRPRRRVRRRWVFLRRWDRPSPAPAPRRKTQRRSRGAGPQPRPGFGQQGDGERVCARGEMGGRGTAVHARVWGGGGGSHTHGPRQHMPTHLHDGRQVANVHEHVRGHREVVGGQGPGRPRR